MAKIPFFGSSYASRSINADCQAAINIYPEVIESQQGKNVGAFYGTPGTTLFATLPEDGCRGLWPGNGSLFAVYGSKLFQVFADGTYHERGDVGNDGNPAFIFPNATGTQILIISAGLAWVDIGGVANGAGTVDVSGTAVSWASGAVFTDAMVGNGFLINNVLYYVTAVTDDHNLTLNWDGGTLTGANFQAILDSGPQLFQPTWNNGTGMVMTNGQFVVLISGNAFDSTLVGNTFNINGTPYTVASLTNANQLALTSSAGSQGSVGWTTTDSTTGLGAAYNGTVTALVAYGQGTFTQAMVGQVITFADSSTANILSVQSPTQLTIDNVSLVEGGVPYVATLPVTAATGALLDTFGIVAPPKSVQFYISASDDFTSWDPTDVASKESYPDYIAALLADHEALVVFGQLESAELWRNQGNPIFPFQRDDSGAQHYALAAQFSPARVLNGFGWLANDVRRGGIQAFYSQGFQATRISTSAIEETWRKYSTISDAIGYGYIEDGHHFYVLNFPSGDATWVYDATASQQMNEPMWHQRSYWDGTTHHRQNQSFHCFTGLVTPAASAIDAVHFVGDWQNGNLYIQSLDTFQDNGGAIARVRTCMQLQDENLRVFTDMFQLDCEVGSGPLNPVLDSSRDFGHTFVNPRTRSATTNGDYGQRLRWLRGGSARGRVWRMTITDNAKVALINAYGNQAPGNS